MFSKNINLRLCIFRYILLYFSSDTLLHKWMTLKQTIQWFIEFVSLTLWQFLVGLFDVERTPEPGYRHFLSRLIGSELCIVTLSAAIRHTCSDAEAERSINLDKNNTDTVFSTALSCWWHTIQSTCCIHKGLFINPEHKIISLSKKCF